MTTFSLSIRWLQVKGVYRLSQRWFSEEPPPEIIPSDRTNTQFVLSFSALQKLAKIVLFPSFLSIKLDDSASSQMSQTTKKEDKIIKKAQPEQDNGLPPFSRKQGEK